MSKLRKRNLLILGFICCLMMIPYMVTIANDSANPIAFTLDGVYREYTMGDDEVNWFTFTLSSDGEFEMRVQNYCEGGISYAMYNMDQSIQYKFGSCSTFVGARESEGTPKTETASKYMHAGQYLLKLSGTTGKYRLYGKFISIGANDQGADSYDSPYNYTSGKWITGALVYKGESQEDDTDWYKVSIPSSGNCTMNIKNYMSSTLYYEIRNADLSEKEQSESVYAMNDGAPGTRADTFELKAGVHYIKISGSTGKYMFCFTHPGGSNGSGGSSGKAASTTVNGSDGTKAEEITTTVKGDDDFKGSSFRQLRAKAVKVTKNSIKVSWKRIKGAAKYVVFSNRCGKNYQLMTRTSSTSITNYNLSKGRYYKYLILAMNSSNKIIATSKTIHVCTKGGKYCNFKKIKYTNVGSSLNLAKGKTFKLKVKKIKESSNLKTDLHRAVQYESTNTKVASVSFNGKVKAKKKGTCYIYAYTQDGKSCRVKVKVS